VVGGFLPGAGVTVLAAVWAALAAFGFGQLYVTVRRALR
jgi:hypothetical protein